MPWRAARQCAHPGCWGAALKNGKHCSAHAGTVSATQRYDAQRGSSWSRGYDAAWLAIRAVALERDNYECQECLKQAIRKRATDVDHIVSIRKAPWLRLVLSNLVSLCHECHSSKTAKFDSTFAHNRL